MKRTPAGRAVDVSTGFFDNCRRHLVILGVKERDATSLPVGRRLKGCRWRLLACRMPTRFKFRNPRQGVERGVDTPSLCNILCKDDTNLRKISRHKAPGLVIVVSGLAFGLLAAWASAAGSAISSWALRRVIQITYVGVSALLASVALLASYLPARRASRVDTIVALRYE